jgi:type III secretory pathway component EscR
MGNDNEIINLLRKELSIDLPENIVLNEAAIILSVYINELIQTDFQKLVFILYRIDVNETKLKKILQENPGEVSGRIIADLIIERQLQKIKSRQQFSRQDNNIDENEKW